jgi:hypothetical protein
MCYTIRTRYSCGHISPYHHTDHINSPLSNKTNRDVAQASSETEWPTHKDTMLRGCQDACRRGARCGGLLEKLEVVERNGHGVCDECARNE